MRTEDGLEILKFGHGKYGKVNILHMKVVSDSPGTGKTILTKQNRKVNLQYTPIVRLKSVYNNVGASQQ